MNTFVYSTTYHPNYTCKAWVKFSSVGTLRSVNAPLIALKDNYYYYYSGLINIIYHYQFA